MPIKYYNSGKALRSPRQTCLPAMMHAYFAVQHSLTHTVTGFAVVPKMLHMHTNYTYFDGNTNRTDTSIDLYIKFGHIFSASNLVI